MLFRSPARAALLLALSLPVTLAVACGSPPPPAVAPMMPPASASVAQSPPPPIEEPLTPGEVRCGIDDGPVPIGTRGDDLRRETADRLLRNGGGGEGEGALSHEDGVFLGKRMMKMEMEEPDVRSVVGPAKAHVALVWSLATGLARAPAFEERAGACRDLALPDDAGEATYSVRLAAGGAPLSVRPASARGPSKLALCFASSLCSLGAQASGAPSRRLDVQLRTSITPPVFTGTVEISLTGEHTPKKIRTPNAPQGRRGRRFIPPPPTPPLTAADRAYVAKVVKDARPGVLACAQRTPPNGQLFVAGAVKAPKPASPYKKVDMAEPPPRSRMRNVEFEYQTQMGACFRAALEAVLTTPPKSFSDTGTVFANATYLPGPEAPPPPPPAPKP